MDNKKFYLREKGQRLGPFTLEELHDRGITGDTKVWAQGMEGWTKASDVPELYALIAGLPPASKNRSLVITGILILVLVIAGMVWGRSLFTENKKVSVQEIQEKVYNNQELYTNFSPAIVLIEHTYYYQISAAGRKYYFNSIYGSEAFTYLEGLTEDETKARSQSEPIQGTGFFISNDGKILTNRHVVPGNPAGEEAFSIERAFVNQLSSSVDQKKQIDSIRSLKAGYDSTLTSLIADTSASASRIAAVKEKISEAEELLDMSSADNASIKLDDSTLNIIASGPIEIKKVTMQLEIFTSGTREISIDKGTKCTLLATSDNPELDLALIQTQTKQLPVAGLKALDLSRISGMKESGELPQMSEKLIMIGYNQGTIISNTSDGIKPQLTEGKISQNTDSYKLMYTIPALPGSSGSPVIDDKGHVVSVNFAGISDTQSFNYGIQPERVREFLKSNNIF